MKNSSRLLAEMDRKRSCSRRGWLLLEASSRTRRLNCSQDSSLLMKRSGLRDKARTSWRVESATSSSSRSRATTFAARVFSAILRLLTHGDYPKTLVRRSCIRRVGVPTVNENIGHHRAGDAAPARERLLVERRHGGTGCGEGAVDVAREVVDDGRVHDELAVDEELHEKRTQERVVGNLDLDRRQGAKSRQEVRRPEAPPPWRGTRRQEDARGVLSHEIQEVEQRDLVVRDVVGVLDGDCTRSDEV